MSYHLPTFAVVFPENILPISKVDHKENFTKIWKDNQPYKELLEKYKKTGSIQEEIISSTNTKQCYG